MIPYFGLHKGDKPTRIRYQMAITMNPAYCRACWGANPRVKLSFAAQLCEKFKIFPYFRVPYFNSHLRAAVKKHYSEKHPEWEVI